MYRQKNVLLFDTLSNKLEEKHFIDSFKNSPEDFTRCRKFSFKSLFLFIASSIQSSIQRELDKFFQFCLGLDFPTRMVSQSAFSQARLKIKPEAFSAIDQLCITHFYENIPFNKWFGFRLIGIDGTEVVVPKTKETIDEFGKYTTNFMNKTVVLTRVSKAYDVLNDITVDADLVNRKTGEHTLAKKHIDKLEKGDLLLMDRGYPSFDIFRLAKIKGCHFCVRVAISNWKIAKELIDLDKKECVVEIQPGRELKAKYQKNEIDWTPIRVRFIKIHLESGEQEVLITSLLDKEQFPHHLFKELYHLRWGIEESYKTDKHRLKLEDFSGKSVTAILQDFKAKILLANITSIIAFEVNELLLEKSTTNKYQYKVNRVTALSYIKQVLVSFFYQDNITDCLLKISQLLEVNIIPIRPDRHFERKKEKRCRYYRIYPHL